MYSFFVQLLSLSTIILKFIHVVACINDSFFFIVQRYSIVWICHNLFIHSPINGNWVASTFQILQISCYEHFCTSICMDLCLSVSGISIQESYVSSKPQKLELPSRRHKQVWRDTNELYLMLEEHLANILSNCQIYLTLHIYLLCCW